MIVVLGVSLAFADDVSVAVPLEVPADLRLFATVDVVDGKGSVKGPDCAAAASAALAAAAGKGTAIRVVTSREALTPVTEVACRQRKAGDTVSASLVELVAIVVHPGAPATVYPKVTVDRAVQIAEAIAEAGRSDVGAGSVDVLDGGVWVNLGPQTLAEVQDSGVMDPNRRGGAVYERYVPQWVSRWGPLLATVPEVRGAVLEVTVTHEDVTVKKSRKTEIFRFAVPTAVGMSFLKGGLTDDAFLRGVTVERANDAKKRDFQPFVLEVGDAGLPLASQRPEDRGPIDVSVEDLEDE